MLKWTVIHIIITDFYDFGYAGHWWTSTEEAIGITWSNPCGIQITWF